MLCNCYVKVCSVSFFFFFCRIVWNVECGYYLFIYLNSFALSGCHPHFRQLTRKKILFKITRICSRSLTLKPLGEEHKNLFTWQTYEHQIIVWELLFITKSNLLSLYLFLYLFYTFFILKFSFSCMSK